MRQLLSSPVEGTPLANCLNLPRPQSCYQGPCTGHYRCRKLLWITDQRQQLLFLWRSLVDTRNRIPYWAGKFCPPNCAHKRFRVVKRDSIMSCVVQISVLECQMLCVYCCLSLSFFKWRQTVALSSLVHCQARDANTRKADSVYVLFCYLSVILCPHSFTEIFANGWLKYNGGDLGIKIPVIYWRCLLIRLSVMRGSTVLCIYTGVCKCCKNLGTFSKFQVPEG